LAVGVFVYAALLILLLVSGKRTLSKRNAFDFVVTSALGLTLASVITSKDVTLADGVFALLLVIGLQFTITWLAVRFDWMSDSIGYKISSKPRRRYYLTKAGFCRKQ